ncbi:membrane protein [Fulvitalea axinellae]|uniref:Membrane protein n=1 Tax=Fulvitalea axinellae TaxID=1182444 RepID=A0AAU9CK83_9BACT|nr:membrane protein [Fulvitalea axinellae]
MIFRKILPHILACLAFLVLMAGYFSPVFQGKTLAQRDVIEFTGTEHEMHEFNEKENRQIHWTGSSFSGMPIWQSSKLNIFSQIHNVIAGTVPAPIWLMFLGFVGFYILLNAFGIKPWFAFAGAAAYSLSTFHMISILAGHINKVYDIALMAPVIAGVYLVYRGKLLRGALITAFFLGMEIYYRHIQISYYLMIMILFWALFEAIEAYRNKTVPDFIKRSAILAAAAGIAIGANIVTLWSTAEYAKSSTRGGSELSSKVAKGEGEGLSKDYAFDWSYGKAESMTLFIPYFYGGGSHEHPGKDSETYKALTKIGFPPQTAEYVLNFFPNYWGSQPFTVGPVYVGAVIFFLFILGLFTVKGPLKWWALSMTILSLFLAWGKNFSAFNDFFFYYVPLYNKFRTVTMVLVVAEIAMPLLGMVALWNIVTGKIAKADALKGLYGATGVTAFLALFFFVAGGSLLQFTSPKDAQLMAGLTKQAKLPPGTLDSVSEALKADRLALFKGDAFRSLLFTLIAAGLIWAFVQEKIKKMWLGVALCVLVIADLWPVNKRYLNNESFAEKKELKKFNFKKTAADIKILADTTKHYRVFNLAGSPFNDGQTSYFHKSLGGYSAIKLQRYQEVVEEYLSKQHIQTINMLNTRYFILPNPQTGQPEARLNPGAAGNAWFIKSLKIVENADQELASLKNFDPKTTAFMDRRFEDKMPQKGDLNFDGNGSIQLQSYDPEELVYSTNSNSEQFAVFSEVYYQPGWNSYIDGVKVPHTRVDYILRGMIVPAGPHKIVFKFEPNSYKIGSIIGLISSILVIVLLAWAIYVQAKANKAKKSEEVSE